MQTVRRPRQRQTRALRRMPAHHRPCPRRWLIGPAKNSQNSICLGLDPPAARCLGRGWRGTKMCVSVSKEFRARLLDEVPMFLRHVVERRAAAACRRRPSPGSPPTPSQNLRSPLVPYRARAIISSWFPFEGRRRSCVRARARGGGRSPPWSPARGRRSRRGTRAGRRASALDRRRGGRRAPVEHPVDVADGEGPHASTPSLARRDPTATPWCRGSRWRASGRRRRRRGRSPIASGRRTGASPCRRPNRSPRPRPGRR